ncbi:MAG: dihydrodipicolinate synthase family protein, partial [Pseudoflavonifractor sp.]
MREPVFTGTCPALVTPFTESGAIDYEAFGRQIDRQLAGGVDAVCVCGTTGESATMSIREHIAAVEFCVKHVNCRAKVIAGAGSNDTSAAVYLSQHAQDSRADALLQVTPYYNKCSQTGLVKHY